MKKLTIKSILLVSLVFIMNIYAFDDNRKGFILGFGLGTHFHSYTETEQQGTYIHTDSSMNGFGFATDFIIGFAPTNSFTIYYSNKVAWFPDGSQIVATGVTGLGITKHFIFNEKMDFGADGKEHSVWSPSLFICGGLGLSTWRYPFDVYNKSVSRGLGLFLGMGYEFKRHLSVEFNFLYSNPSVDTGDSIYQTKSKIFMITLKGFKY